MSLLTYVVNMLGVACFFMLTGYLMGHNDRSRNMYHTTCAGCGRTGPIAFDKDEAYIMASATGWDLETGVMYCMGCKSGKKKTDITASDKDENGSKTEHALVKRPYDC